MRTHIVCASNFKSTFVSTEGWGSFSQKRELGKQTCRIEMKYGKLNLSQINLQLTKAKELLSVNINETPTRDFDFIETTGELTVELSNTVLLDGDDMQITCLFK